MDPNIALAIVIVALFVGVVYGYFTVQGSGISERPYNKIYGGAPGAHGPGSASGHDDRVSCGTGLGGLANRLARDSPG